jgi:DNA invertase Pin-like site-specific DNA recombinase
MALVGYARVSSVGQSLVVQLDKLKHCDKIFQDTHSGALGRRPSLQACLDSVREGDTLVITRLDRLARSTLHLCQIADDLERKHVGLQVLDQHIDTSHATGRLLFHMLGALAQFETELRAERQVDGIQQAKARGVRFGPKKRLALEQVAELRQRRARGALIKTLMQDFGLSKASVYRYLATRDVSL